MKSLLLILFLISGFFQNNMTDITKAISTGDIETLAAYFDEDVEIAILGEEDIYSKTEAKQIVKSFFVKNTPMAFSQVHKGTSKGENAHYCIGNLKTDTNTFRVYVYTKHDSGKYIIQELRFDRE